MYRRHHPRTIDTLLAVATLIVCAWPLAAQDSSAKVIYQVGQVSVTNSGLPQMLNTGPDGFVKFQVLSDGSTFEVYPNSRVIFRETPGSWEHLLNVWMGRV